MGTFPRVITTVRGYLQGRSPLRDFYRWDPREPQEQLVESLTARASGREELAAILTDQNRSWGADNALVEGIARLRDPRASMVGTGQQVGLFGGPLYTLYKALPVVAVARQLESQWQIPCLPLFWMASEDTDFAEIDHVAMPDEQDRVTLLRYVPHEGFGTDLPANHTFTPEIGGVFDAFRQAAGAGRLQGEGFALVPDCFRPGG